MTQTKTASSGHAVEVYKIAARDRRPQPKKMATVYHGRHYYLNRSNNYPSITFFHLL
jgi:hypothetical protein